MKRFTFILAAACLALAGCTTPIDAAEDVETAELPMVNAKNLPDLLNASTWAADGRVVHGGMTKCIASYEGMWKLSPDPDLFKISEANFNAIRGATVSNAGAGPTLVIGGQVQEVAAAYNEDDGFRWILLRSPE